MLRPHPLACAGTGPVLVVKCVEWCRRGFRESKFLAPKAAHMGDKCPLLRDALVKQREAVTVFFDGEVRDGPQDFAQKVNNGADVTETRLRDPDMSEQ